MLELMERGCKRKKNAWGRAEDRRQMERGDSAERESERERESKRWREGRFVFN